MAAGRDKAPDSLQRTGSQALNMTLSELEEQLGHAKSVGEMSLVSVKPMRPHVVA